MYITQVELSINSFMSAIHVSHARDSPFFYVTPSFPQMGDKLGGKLGIWILSHLSQVLDSLLKDCTALQSFAHIKVNLCEVRNIFIIKNQKGEDSCENLWLTPEVGVFHFHSISPVQNSVHSYQLVSPVIYTPMHILQKYVSPSLNQNRIILMLLMEKQHLNRSTQCLSPL